MQILKRSLLASLMIALMFAAPAFAQQTTGSISGTVTDPDGAPLPGVAVTMTSPDAATATVYSQTNGVFRFPVLPPGDEYTLTLALAGFRTIVQEGIPVRLAANSQIDVTMELSTVEETVTVTGVTPIVDVKKTGTGSNISERQMQSIPSARDPWVMMQQTAGMQVNKENVGGSESGQQSRYTATGNRVGDSIWTYDGAEMTDMAALGASPAYYDFDAFEEIQINYGGNDPSIQSGGVRIGFVTKRGGNAWRGSGRFYLTDGGLSSLNVGDPATGELVGDFTSAQLFPGYIGNSIDNIKDWGFEVGGPLARDKFFIWGALGKQDIKQFVATTPDDTQLTNWHAKGNAHLGNKAVVNFTYMLAEKTKQGRGASATRQGPTTWNQGGPTDTYTAKAQYTINDNNYLEATWNYSGLGFFLEPQGGRDIQVSRDLDTGIWGNSYFIYDTQRPLYNAKLDGNSYIAGADVDHELKYGYSYRNNEVTSFGSTPAGGAIVYFDAGVPDYVRLYHAALNHYEGTRNSFYLGDTISAGRLTVNLGLRYDNQTSRGLPSEVTAHPIAPDLFPAISYTGTDTGHAWNTLSPRFGLTYDLSGDSRTILRFNAARYAAQMSSGEFHYDNTTFGPQMRFDWNDINGNGFVEPGETVGDPFFTSAGFDPDNPNAASLNQFAETSSPWSDELIIGLERELTRTLGIGADFTYRNNHNETWTIRPGEDSPGFWCDASRTLSGQSVSFFQPCGARAGFTNYGQRPGYSTRYVGVTAFLNKRFANNWMGNASFTWADPTVHYEVGGYTDPTNISFQDGQAFAPLGQDGGASGGAARWYLKFSGMYQLPSGFSIAGFFQAREGHILQDYFNVTGRANGAGTVQALVDSVGSNRLNNFWNLDLRAEKTLDLGDRGRVHFVADAFNVTNNTTVLGEYERINSSSYTRITDIIQGRTIRFGVRLVLR